MAEKSCVTDYSLAACLASIRMREHFGFFFAFRCSIPYFLQVSFLLFPSLLSALFAVFVKVFIWSVFGIVVSAINLFRKERKT